MSDELIIREVWSHNLEQEMAIIADLINDYPYVGMDTEFPGVIAHPFGQFQSQEAFQYTLMRINVDYLKIIQIGISLGDAKGNFPSPCCCWQFNFKFNLDEDMFTTPAIDLLQQSGIDFSKFNTDGINVYEFSQLLYTSGLVMNDDVTFVTFHSSSDFGYLFKMLSCKPLPSDLKTFMNSLCVYFPHFYDLKLMANDIEQISTGGLQGLANELNVLRVGPQHQAGSDALITLKTFTALVNKFFNGNLQNKAFENKLFGLVEE
ncbi:CAF1 family ribonuclease containing protein [Histomonas meleagridis]|uniref:CAF1 family ribonuclease containing protein n=1 Tax=Histomonas meleagridis TaxID=135588 RepID=UPI00355A6645|nr:CAF1 family ribonuclease containing protein [Histomonas meleagridis]KAH0798465.1 CAF1 family ribonuclease containing protein [Histomonas meleagridis]